MCVSSCLLFCLAPDLGNIISDGDIPLVCRFVECGEQVQVPLALAAADGLDKELIGMLLESVYALKKVVDVTRGEVHRNEVIIDILHAEHHKEWQSMKSTEDFLCMFSRLEHNAHCRSIFKRHECWLVTPNDTILFKTLDTLMHLRLRHVKDVAQFFQSNLGILDHIHYDLDIFEVKAHDLRELLKA